jgi:hypothetical protein
LPYIASGNLLFKEKNKRELYVNKRDTNKIRYKKPSPENPGTLMFAEFGAH